MASTVIRPGQLVRRIQVRSLNGELTTVESTSPVREPAPPPVDHSQILCELTMAVQEAVRDLEERRKQSLAELQEVAVDLALTAASRIVGEAIDRDVFAVDQVVADVLGRVASSGPVRVGLHPADLKLLKAKRAESVLETPGGVIEFFEDSALKRGCCRAVSGSRAVISDWRTHLAEIRASLHEELEHAQAERRGPEAAHQRVKRYPDRRETA
jgi:flagellar biosynthesis/type III secretory pathway protein FliH